MTAGVGVHHGSRYEERAPASELAPLLSSVWVQQIAADALPYAHLNVPNGCVELVCRFGETPRIVGPLTRGVVELLDPGSAVVGVRFRPAAAAPDPLVTEAVRRLMPWGAQDVGSLRTSLFISERQFRRRLESSIGLAPKTLHRVLRFQGFLALAQFAVSQGKDPASDGLGSLAIESGYADQSHLTRECVRLAGASPKSFLHQMTHQCGPDHHHEVSFVPMLSARGAAHD